MSKEQHISKRMLTIDDLQHIAVLSGASLSADGKLVAYVTTKVVLEENAHKDFITVIDVISKQAIIVWEGSAPQWSPIAKEIAYLASFNGVSYIWIYSLDSDVRKPLAPVNESHYFMGHLAVKDFKWSPDGRYIAYISAELYTIGKPGTNNIKVIDRLLYKTKGGRGRPLVTDDALSHIWVVGINTGEPLLITPGNFNEHSLCWSPGCKQIAFVSNRSSDPDNNQLHDLWSIDLDTAILSRHTQNFGTVYQPSWSHDGSYIAFLATRSKVATNDSPAEDTQLYVMACGDNTFRCLTQSFDRRIEQASWHPKMNTIFFTAGNNGTTSIYNVDVDNGTVDHVAGEHCHILEYAPGETGAFICFVSTDTTHLTEIFIHEVNAKINRQVSNNTDNLLHYCRLQDTQTFWFKSFDGLNVQGWLMKPGNFNPGEKYPLVLVIHGGPHNMFGYEFEDRVQLLSANGYGVLYINPRGSSGYGQAFSNGCVLNWGGGDYKDLMAGVDAAIQANDWIDLDRMGVTGQSYGGFMTNWIITQTQRFKAAVVDGGISNLVSFAGTSLYHSLMESEFNGSVYNNVEVLWQWSPLRNIRNVTTPTLILHGEVDNEVPLSQAEEMYIALKKMGVDSTMVQYLGEGHGWRPDMKPGNRYDVLKRTVEWFNKYLN
jgi:dipeptidyl aminopeptidase/acylaminoacyl peptidase